MLISVDFDGTCVTHEFPKTGKNIGAEIVLKALTDAGHKIICMSMRSQEQKGNTVQQIKDWFNKYDIPLYAINDNPEQKEWSKSRKVYAHTYIDDQFLGCPLKLDPYFSNRVFVDWLKVTRLLNIQGFLTTTQATDVIEDLVKKYPDLYNAYL